MDGLTKCPGGDCPLKETCLRIQPIGRGDTYLNVPYDTELEACAHYMDGEIGDLCLLK